MSITDTIGPTPERLAKIPKGRLERPELTQTVKRVAYRKLDMFEGLHKSGRISDACLRASQKLTLHYMGAQGVNVGKGNGGHIDMDREDSRTYHSQMVARIRQTVDSPRQWGALCEMIEETADLEAIGRGWMKCRQRGQAYIAGVSLVAMGLETIAEAYGMTDHFHPPNRRV